MTATIWGADSDVCEAHFLRNDRWAGGRRGEASELSPFNAEIGPIEVTLLGFRPAEFPAAWPSSTCVLPLQALFLMASQELHTNRALIPVYGSPDTFHRRSQHSLSIR